MNYLYLNRQAKFNYVLIDSFECGIVLHGYEVKSILAGKVDMRDSYVRISQDGEVWLMGCRVEPYGESRGADIDPIRTRKLLLKRQEIRKLIGKMKEKGITLIADAAYLGGHDSQKIKIRVWISSGKTKVDKKRVKKERDLKRCVD